MTDCMYMFGEIDLCIIITENMEYSRVDSLDRPSRYFVPGIYVFIAG